MAKGIPCLVCRSQGKDTAGNNQISFNDHTYCFVCKTRINKNNKMANNDFKGEYQDLEDRQLSKNTCEFLGIKKGILWNKDAVIYQYDKGIKVRFDNKEFVWTEGNSNDCMMFGLDKALDFTKPIIITEGEYDTAACYQVGYQAASIHSGAGSVKKCIEHDRDVLLKYPEIWWYGDNDTPGLEAKEIAIKLLPIEKLKFIDSGKYKDANEALKVGELEKILKQKHKAWKPEGILFGDEINWNKIWEPRPVGLKLPWKKVQSKIKGLHKGRLYLVGGGASIGKSSVLRELSFYLANEYKDLKIAHLFLEEDPEAGPLSYVALANNIPLGELLENKELISNEDKDVIAKTFNKNIVFTNEQYELGSEDLLKQLEWLATVMHYDVVFLDHISMVAEASDSKESERILINKLMLSLRALVRKTGLIVVAACHLSNPADNGKDWEDGRAVRQKDFHGSSALRKVPDVMIGVERNMRDPFKCDQLLLRVIKNRWFSQVGEADYLYYITETGRLEC